MTRQFTSLTICLVAAGMSLSAQTPVKSDYNADGKSDVLYFNSMNSAAYELQMFNSSIALSGFVHTPTSPNWVIAASGINPTTGKSDLFWQNKVTGQVFKMVMNGVSYDTTASKFVYTDMNADWQVIAAADFDHDGIADLLFRNVRTGTLYLQPLNVDGSLKAGITLYTEPNLNWKPVSVSPNASLPGENDLIWYNFATGDVYQMLINSNGTVGAASKVIYTATSTDWQLVSADDYNRDGITDLLFWNKMSGDVYVVILDGNGKPTAASRTIHNANPANWEIVATGDYNGDGYADILWRNITAPADATTGQLYMQFIKVDPITGLVGINTSDSTVVYSEPNLAWRPTGGITSVGIEAPMTTLKDNPITNTDSFSWKLVDPAVIKPGNFPKLYVTVGDMLLFSSAVTGPVKDNSVYFTSFKPDNSGDVTVPVLSGASFISGIVQDVIVMAHSNADPTKISSRYVSVVAAPGVTTLAATPTTITPGGKSVLNYTLTAGNTGILTNDIDPNFNQQLTATSGTITVSPAATAHYTLQAINQAGKTASSSASVTVSANSTALDCTVSILGAYTAPPVFPALIGVTSATSGGVYLVQVPAEPGVTYTWSVQGANLIAGQGTNQISVVIGPAGSAAIFTCRKDLNGAFNTGSLTANSVTAPTVPTGLAVYEGVKLEKVYLTGLNNTANASVTSVPGMTFKWTITGATNVDSSTNPDGSYVTFTPAASGIVGISVVETNLAGTISTAATANRTIVTDPTGTKITPSAAKAFVTPTFVGNGMASVPNIGSGSTYAWTLPAGPGPIGTAVGATNAPAVSYTLAALNAVPGNTVPLSVLITNGAGDTYTANTTQTIAAPPTTPSAITFTGNASKVTVGNTLQATAQPGVGDASGVATWNTMTYNWTVTNATIVGSATGATISFKPIAAGPVGFTAVQVNPSGLLSGVCAAPTAPAVGSLTAVAPPTITSFGITNGVAAGVPGVMTVGDTANLTMAFGNGTGVITDTLGVKSGSVVNSPNAAILPVTGIASVSTTQAVSGLAMNWLGYPHTLTLTVTNDAGDFVTKTVTADVAAAPSITPATGFKAYADAAGSTAATYPINYGTPLWLGVNYSVDSPATNLFYGGQTASIIPGSAGYVPATGSFNLITPPELSTIYTLTVTNRAKKAATATVTTVVNPVAITFTPSAMLVTGTQSMPAATTVTGAVNTLATYTIVSDTTGGASFDTLTGTILTAGPNAGTITVMATSQADTKKTVTFPIVVTAS